MIILNLIFLKPFYTYSYMYNYSDVISIFYYINYKR